MLQLKLTNKTEVGSMKHGRGCLAGPVIAADCYFT